MEKRTAAAACPEFFLHTILTQIMADEFYFSGCKFRIALQGEKIGSSTCAVLPLVVYGERDNSGQGMTVRGTVEVRGGVKRFGSLMVTSGWGSHPGPAAPQR